MDEAVGVVLGPGGGEMVDSPVGGMLTFKATGAVSAGRVMAMESLIPPGEGPPLHVHAKEDEMLYVLEGEFRFQIGDDLHDAPAGSFVYVPRGVPHVWQNAGETPGRLLVYFTPAGMERFFALADGDRAAFDSVAEQVGMSVVGPPLRS
jgi:quercetin dioxygenase-like cupin family protein